MWWMCVALLASPQEIPLQGPLRVDLNPDNGRADVRSVGWENWGFDPKKPARAFGPVTVAFRSGASLRVRWYKPLLVHGATLTSDGLAADGSLTMVITGLAPGPHTLASYHSEPNDGPAAALDILVDGVIKARGVQPSQRVPDDADGACAFVEFQAGDEPVLIEFRAAGPGEVILNGFEIDAADPNRKATKPVPSDGDDHADADSLALSWSSRRPAEAHDLYLGPDRAAVASAGRSSAEYKGRLGAASHKADGLSSSRDTFWRVDEIDASGKVTRGDVWRFRARHLAFPGAEGFGRFARGGRGGRVLEVTNLNDAGPGSLRAALDAKGPRTVLFRSSGVIALESPLTIANPYVTVAGQTAPGDGICVRNYSFGTSAGSSDVIVRFVRVRVGDLAGRSLDGMGLGGAHSIFDHCSISWSIDEGLDSRTARHSTFQRCIISEALDDSFQRHPHAFAGSIGGEFVSYHHNLLAHCTGRNWSLAGGYDNAVHFAGQLEIRNNVVYNWKHRTTDGGAKRVDFVNNYYRPGPASRVFVIMKPDIGRPGDRQVYHIAGNVMEGHPEDAENWNGVVPNGQAPLSEIKSDQPLIPSNVTTTSAELAFRNVLSDVGATRPRPDAIDTRIIAEVRGGRFTYQGSKGHIPGIIDSQNDLGPNPWPDYKTYNVPDDSDHDGLPDSWERKHGLNPNSPPGDDSDSNGDPDGDGFTNLEDYLNELSARSTPADENSPR